MKKKMRPGDSEKNNMDDRQETELLTILPLLHESGTLVDTWSTKACWTKRIATPGKNSTEKRKSCMILLVQELFCPNADFVGEKNP